MVPKMLRQINSKVYLLLIFLLANLTACENKPVSEIEALKATVKDRIDSDMANLATFESVYNLAYKNTQTTFYSENFYVRQEAARVPYGYDISDISVEVVSIQNQNFLKVSLPAKPKRMPIDRKMIRRPIMSSDDYKVKDSSGNTVDVDAVINSNLQEMIDKYENFAMDNAKELTRQYFKNLAQSFNLDLKLEYRE